MEQKEYLINPVNQLKVVIQIQKMCGIWGCIGTKCEKAEECTKTLHERGPEHLAVKQLGDVTLGFTRLAINGLTQAGNQPFQYDGVHWICNGQIYNCIDLRDRHKLQGWNGSDCSVIGPLYRKYNGDANILFKSFDGVFAIVLYDSKNGKVFLGRDPYGVRPMFIGTGKQGGTFVGSQIKSLTPVCSKVEVFPSSHWAELDSKTGTQVFRRKYHHVPYLKNPLYTPQYEGGLKLAKMAVRQTLAYAVKKRLLTQRPVCALLSGGIDSSLIAALVQKQLKALGKPPLKTFSIGFKGSPDLKYAKIVAQHIQSQHTQVISTPQEFFESIPQVIKTIESFDITSVRASVGNWLVCKQIRKTCDCKVVFNGDGSDEVFGSYLYFKKAPSNEDFQEQSARLLTDIHHYDVLRSDRSISSHGLEARTPFLDKQFVNVARSVATQWRLNKQAKQSCAQKWILRMAFQDTNLLPEEVLWRRKQAFSDGVSQETKSWYEEIQERVAEKGIDWESGCNKYTHLKPYTAESYYYRSIFDSLYGKAAQECIPYFWLPKWSGQTKDPSARTLNHY